MNQPLTNCSLAVTDERLNFLWGQRIRFCCPHFVEKSLKAFNIDLSNRIEVLVLVVENANWCRHRFRCWFKCSEIIDYIADAYLIAAGFLPAVLAGDVPAVKKPFGLALADSADTV